VNRVSYYKIISALKNTLGKNCVNSQSGIESKLVWQKRKPTHAMGKGGKAVARADLLVNLVKAGVTGDSQSVKSVTEVIVAEERAKQHTVLAERLEHVLRVNGSGPHGVNGVAVRHPAKEFVHELIPRRRLEELILTSRVRSACRQLVEEQLHASVLRSHGLNARHRLLLVGPPGNGKTSIAEAIAEALAVPFLVVRYESLIASFLGETAGRLKRVFEYARTIPCVLFFDEFDVIGKERGDVHETGEIKRVVASLLMQVDDLPSHSVIIAASNHAELLDRATWRRFQIRLTLPPPTARALEEYFTTVLKSFGEPTGIAAKTIVKRLGPLSFAEAEEFTLDVRRQHALGLGQRSLKSVLQEVVPTWEERAKAVMADAKANP
jgi:AAA+ superfamily predicted ATPase